MASPPASRLSATKGEVAHFHAIVPKGWLFFEALTAWHFWPTEDLLAIAFTSSRLLFVYDRATLGVGPIQLLCAMRVTDEWRAQLPPDITR